MKSDHLTSEQMDVLLSHEEQREQSQHLRTCGTCSEEFAALLAGMNDLRAAVIASAEQHRRLAMMPATARRTPRFMWALVATMALICAAMPLVLRTRPAAIAVVQAPKQPAQASVSDEQLMSDIQQDLSSSVPQAMLPLTAKDTSAGATSSTYNSKENE
jgi:anti-sigma factor RsiW